MFSCIGTPCAVADHSHTADCHRTMQIPFWPNDLALHINRSLCKSNDSLDAFIQSMHRDSVMHQSRIASAVCDEHWDRLNNIESHDTRLDLCREKQSRMQKWSWNRNFEIEMISFVQFRQTYILFIHDGLVTYGWINIMPNMLWLVNKFAYKIHIISFFIRI